MITLDKEQASPVAQVIEIEQGEPLIVPDAFQRALGLEEGGTYTVIQLDGLVLVTPKRLASLEALEELRFALKKSNITLENLLVGLDSVREQIYQERYITQN
jgi:hypothetical protein